MATLTTQGTTLALQGGSPLTYTTIANVMNVGGPSGSAKRITTTNLSSTAEEFNLGLQSSGDISFSIQYLPANTQHAALNAARKAGTLCSFQLTFTDSPATTWTFSAYVTDFGVDTPLDDILMANVTIAITGAITEA